jgi:hypothetical protein
VVGDYDGNDGRLRRLFPVTTSGRFVAVALILMGIALVGSITAAVAAWLIAHVEREEGPTPIGASKTPRT